MTSARSHHRSAIDPDVAGKRVLILGGGLWQRDYVRRARQLGAEVWVTDWSPAAIARGDANHFAPIDLRDRESTLALAREARIDAVFTAADIGVPTAAYVADALGLPGSPLDLAERATNKFEMRRHARAAGLRCPWFVRVTNGGSARDAVSGRTLPVIVKPADNCSSRGVQVVRRLEELGPAIDAALGVSSSGTALVEDFMTGREGSIEALVQNGAVTVLGICDKTKSPLPDRFDLELRYPGAYPDALRRRIEGFARALVSGFGIANALLHIEFMVSEPDEDVFLIEFALRGCGSKVITHLIPQLAGIDVVHAVVRQALGLTTPMQPEMSVHGVLHFLMFPTGTIAGVHGLERAGRIPGVIDLTLERGPGDVLAPVHDGRSRPGHLLACAATAAAVQDIVRQVQATVRVEYQGGAMASPTPIESTVARA